MTALLASWGSLYANHAALRTIVAFLHVGPLVAGGGTAIAADRSLLRAVRHDAESRRALLGTLRSVHRVVIASLVVLVLSGLLMFATDVDTFLYSRVFWIKMALVVLLLANGGLIWRAERRAEADEAAGWRMLRVTAVTSISLWLLTTLAGLALQNIG
jgi:uncharacterized membrane protein